MCFWFCLQSKIITIILSATFSRCDDDDNRTRISCIQSKSQQWQHEISSLEVANILSLQEQLVLRNLSERVHITGSLCPKLQPRSGDNQQLSARFNCTCSHTSGLSAAHRPALRGSGVEHLLNPPPPPVYLVHPRWLSNAATRNLKQEVQSQHPVCDHSSEERWSIQQYINKLC